MTGLPRVGMVVVSHSALISDGVVALAGQMAPDVRIIGAGGSDEGGIGTSFERVSRALAAAERGAGVVVLSDLGSAGMTAESAREFLDADQREHVRIVDAPLVEGAVAGAVAAQVGGDISAVASASMAAWGSSALATAPREPLVGERIPVEGAEGHTRTVTLINADGLHARPAAEFVRLASKFDSRVTVNGIDAKSLLGIMALGLLHGQTIEIAGGADSADAVEALADLVKSGFDDLPAT